MGRVDPDAELEPPGYAHQPPTLGQAALAAHAGELELERQQEITRAIELELSLREHLANRVRATVGQFAPENLEELIAYDALEERVSVEIDGIVFEGWRDERAHGRFFGPVVGFVVVTDLATLGYALSDPNEPTNPPTPDPCALAWAALDRMIAAHDEIDAAYDHAKSLDRRDLT